MTHGDLLPLLLGQPLEAALRDNACHTNDSIFPLRTNQRANITGYRGVNEAWIHSLLQNRVFFVEIGSDHSQSTISVSVTVSLSAARATAAAEAAVASASYERADCRRSQCFTTSHSLVVSTSMSRWHCASTAASDPRASYANRGKT